VPMEPVKIERGGPDDAAGIVQVLATVVAERIFSAIDAAWTVEQEASYLGSLSPREALYVARDSTTSIVGFQTLDLWSTLLPSMAHVGQVGTFLLPGWRGVSIGRQLWGATEAFARQVGYEKLVVQVRASNMGARRFYRGLGFTECGLLTRQVCIDGHFDDELLMELFLRQS